MTDIRPTTVRELMDAPGWQELSHEYFEECADKNLGTELNFDMDRLRDMEAYRIATVLAMFDGRELLGLTYLIESPSLYEKGAKVYTCEFIFLRKKYRTGARGLRLMAAAEDWAKAQGASGVYYSAISRSVMEKLCIARRMKLTHAIFYKPL